MDSALLIHRLHFAFTVTFHYLFPQLTMGLAPLIVILKTLALKTKDERYDEAARFWAKIFGINFVIGVVTGIPMEFQFGTNWSHFSRFAGGVIGQTLAMEGCFAFFLESTFLGLFLYGEKRLSKGLHWFSALMVFLGSWMSGYFIVATDAWMQHPVGYERAADGSLQLSSFWQLILNPWAWWQYAHNMSGAVITGTFVMTAVGAFYLLSQKHVEQGRIFVRVGVIVSLLVSVFQVVPTGDAQGRMLARNQPVTLAAMEALWETQPGAPLVILGQPDVVAKRIDNPMVIPKMLSFLTWRSWGAEVKGLNSVPKEDWPENIPLLYYTYHIMVGLGTIFIAVSAVATFLLWREKALPGALDAVDSAADVPVPLHRQHGRLDDSRDRPAAVAGVWPAAYRGRLLQDGVGRQRLVQLPGLPRHVHRAGGAVPVPGAARNRARSGAGDVAGCAKKLR